MLISILLSCVHKVVIIDCDISVQQPVDVFVVIRVHHGRVADAVQCLLLLLAHDQSIVKPVDWRWRLPRHRIVHDLLVVEGGHPLLVEFIF